MLVSENRVRAMGKEFLTRTGSESQQMRLVPPYPSGIRTPWSNGLTVRNDPDVHSGDNPFALTEELFSDCDGVSKTNKLLKEDLVQRPST